MKGPLSRAENSARTAQTAAVRAEPHTFSGPRAPPRASGRWARGAGMRRGLTDRFVAAIVERKGRADVEGTKRMERVGTECLVQSWTWAFDVAGSDGARPVWEGNRGEN